MEIKQSYLTVSKTARYSTFGELNPKTKYFWLVLHGSNMQCEQVLYKFSDFDPEEHFVVAPEGLNRFYKDGFGGDVVASWMTKRDRLEEIRDFSDYLTKLYQQYLEQLPASCVTVMLGFSQGGTTLYRWLHAQKAVASHIVAYSCSIPEDINLKESATNLNEANLIYTYGKQDQFLTEKRIEQIRGIINENSLRVIMEPYEGIHRIEKNQLAYLFDKYIKKGK